MKNDHDLQTCRKFESLDVNGRWDAAKNNRICFSCLKKGHRSGDCDKPNECKINGCRSNHHQLLHYRSQKNWNERNEEKGPSGEDHFFGAVQIAAEPVGRLPQGETWMRVLPVILRNGNKTIEVNAFLDDGSELTLIDDDLAKQLKLEGQPDSLNLGWINGTNTKDSSSRKVKLEIAAAAEGSQFYQLENVRTKLNLSLPLQALQHYKFWRKWKHLRNIPVNEALVSNPRILIGQDNIHLTVPREIREGMWNEPMASLTKLGWVVHGHTSAERKQGPNLMGAALMGAAFQKKEGYDQLQRPVDDLKIQEGSIENETRNEEVKNCQLEDGMKFQSENMPLSGFLWRGNCRSHHFSENNDDKEPNFEVGGQKPTSVKANGTSNLYSVEKYFERNHNEDEETEFCRRSSVDGSKLDELCIQSSVVAVPKINAEIFKKEVAKLDCAAKDKEKNEIGNDEWKYTSEGLKNKERIKTLKREDVKLEGFGRKFRRLVQKAIRMSMCHRRPRIKTVKQDRSSTMKSRSVVSDTPTSCHLEGYVGDTMYKPFNAVASLRDSSVMS